MTETTQESAGAPQKREPLVRAVGFNKTFRATGVLRRTPPVHALKDVSFEVYPGEVVALIGESGSGKTTCGKALLRLTELDTGEIWFEGVDIRSLDTKALVEARRSFQMVFQNQSANLHPKMTVFQMLDESIRLHRPSLDEDGRKALAEELLARVNMSERASQLPRSLSGGEQRRVGLARILATQPKFIVADEPTSGLDAAIKLEIIDLLRRLKEAEMAYLLITHDLGLVRRIADRVLVMLDGAIIEEVGIEDLRAGAVKNDYTRKLLASVDLERYSERQGAEASA